MIPDNCQSFLVEWETQQQDCPRKFLKQKKKYPAAKLVM